MRRTLFLACALILFPGITRDPPHESLPPLVPRMPVKAAVPESVVYEYYTPAVRAVAAPQVLEVL